MSDQKNRKAFHEDELSELDRYFETMKSRSQVEQSATEEMDIAALIREDLSRQDESDEWESEVRDGELPTIPPIISNEESEPDDTFEEGYIPEKVYKKKTGISRRPLVVILVVALVIIALIGGYFRMSTVVPDVSGMSAEEATERLQEASLYVSENEEVYSDQIANGCVVTVEHAGQRVKKNSGVKITVSLGAEVIVSDVIGQELENASAELVDAGLTVITETVYSEEYTKDVVMEQSIEKGSSVSQGTEIILTVSLGAEPFEMEDYSEQTIKAAKKALEKSGLSVEVEKVYSSEVEEGLVVSHSPAAGEMVTEGDVVTLQVSKGPEQVVVPDLSGMTVEAAEEALEEVGLALGNTTSVYSDTVSSGYITAQTETAGSKADEGTSISVSVSIGKQLSSSSSSSSSRRSSSSSGSSSSNSGSSSGSSSSGSSSNSGSSGSSSSGSGNSSSGGNDNAISNSDTTVIN